MVERKDIEEILKKYGAKIEKQIATEPIKEGDYSREYLKFKKEIAPALSFYERLCKNIGGIIKLKLKKEEEAKISKQLEVAHLDVSSRDVAGLAMISFLGILFLSLLLLSVFYLFTGKFSFLAFFLIFLIAIFVYYYTNSLPARFAQSWRLKASSQMVPCILYVVVYMRHTSNLELAIRFASDHLQAPLALDFKKIFWDVQTGKYKSIKESLDAYLESWRDYSLEFLEAFHLIEGSLYEPEEARRVEILEKSLTVILDGVFEKTLHYAHDIVSPLTNVYMLGIVLPTLAIAILPLASTLVGGAITWPHIALLFNVLIPFFVFYLTSQILVKRPGGYGEAELLEQHPEYSFYKSKKHYYRAALIAAPLFLIGILPLLFQFTPLPELFGLQHDYTFGQLGIPFLSDIQIFDFKTADGKSVGPFGPIALLLSLFIPLSIALFFSISYRAKTSKLIKTRETTKALENEFASSLFQLGNRLGDGIPAEMAFGRVAAALKGTPTAEFFRTVNSNIQELGMSVREAIFNSQRGAIIWFPSSLVRTSMEIMVEAVKKGLKVAANALISISEYVKNIHKINERLRDLLADIVSSMKSNMNFLAPVLAGIVVGLAAMITAILNRLQTMLSAGVISGETSVGALGNVGTLTTMFDISKMIPPYWLQVVIGIYLVEIIYILTITLVTVSSGVDKLSEKAEIASNMSKGIIFYIVVAIIATLALSALAGVAVSGMVGG